MNSNPVGRALLRWYFNYEDYWCLLGAIQSMLPMEWREENVRRQQQSEERTGFGNDRAKRSLDDLHAELNTLTPQCSDLTYRISRLKQDTQNIADIKNDLISFERNVNDFLESSRSKEILESSCQHSTRQAVLGPPSAFPGVRFQSVEAGLLLIACMSYLCFIYFNLYTRLCLHENYDCGFQEAVSGAEFYARQICEAVTALEYVFETNPYEMLPCSTAICLAAASIQDTEGSKDSMTIPLRRLKHSGFILDRKYGDRLAAIWDIPNIDTAQSSTHIHRVRVLCQKGAMIESDEFG
jgi:hypothetical protein